MEENPHSVRRHGTLPIPFHLLHVLTAESQNTWLKGINTSPRSSHHEESGGQYSRTLWASKYIVVFYRRMRSVGWGRDFKG